MGQDARNRTLALKASANEIALWRRLAAKKDMTLSGFVLLPIREATKGKKA